MVREGYGTSGDNGATVGANALKGDRAEVLPLLARDHNLSRSPGSDVRTAPGASDAGSGNDGRAPKNARSRGALHGEVLLATKTVQKKKPYKSLGWSLIAVRPAPDPSPTPRRNPKHSPRRSEIRAPVDRGSETPRRGTRRPERHPTSRTSPNPARSSQNTSPSTFLDPPAQAAAGHPRGVRGGRRRRAVQHRRPRPARSTAKPPSCASIWEATTRTPHTPSPTTRFVSRLSPPVASPRRSRRVARRRRVALEVGGGPRRLRRVGRSRGCVRGVVRPRVGAPRPRQGPVRRLRLVPASIRSGARLPPAPASKPPSISNCQDHYENLPDVTAFVRGDFHRDVADAKQRLVRVANRAGRRRVPTPSTFPRRRRMTSSRSDSSTRRRANSCRCGRTSAGVWKASWATPRVPAAHVSRCWRGLVDEFGEFTGRTKEEEEAL